MKKDHLRWHKAVLPLAALTLLSLAVPFHAMAVPVPGGTLNPLAIPKYVTPLVIPPEMPKSVTSPAPAADYDIAVRQFKQQILPGGIWGSSFPNPEGAGTVGAFPASTVWSYGRAADPLPDSSGITGGAVGVAPAQNSSFNYPAFTVEATTALPTKVRWINDLVADPIACGASVDKTIAACNFLPHLFNVDQTLHWANPPKANCAMMPANRTDCHTEVAAPYTGPVPIVTHVHGSHVQPHSDGYPEAWWLPGVPGTKNIPLSYADRGSIFTQSDNTNNVPGSAFYSYENTQPATTLWYHDHTLGMTRLNVYAGPAGFWLLRGGSHDTAAGVLPGPAPSGTGDPNFNTAYRNTIREIPVVVQDRSFNTDGTLFFPSTRTFFDGYTGPFIGGTGTPAGPSDISGIWNPEAFFNTMVVNGTTWPKLNVAPARYRLRLLNGCNARTLNLSMFVVSSIGPDGKPGTADDTLSATEVPFYQIGGDQGFLPKVVKILTGTITTLPGGGGAGTPVAAPDARQALLMGPAERADVIIDFSGIPNGTLIRMINTAPDAPFGGFPVAPFLPGDIADPLTTGQVMDFNVNSTIVPVLQSDLNTTPPQNLVLPAEGALGAATNTRQVSLNELSSDQVCVEVNIIDGAIIRTLFSTTPGDPNFQANCAAATVGAGNFPTPMGPRMAQLGVLATDALGNVTAVPKKWGDAFTEIPSLNSTEVWEIYNTTMDAHPIHLHLVRFSVLERQNLDMMTMLPVAGTVTSALPNELGYKDTVIAYPSQITRIKAKFDIEGLYVWHCHIIDHEDNEMMRSYAVHKRRLNADFDGDGLTDIAIWQPGTGDWSIKPSFNGMPYIINYGITGDKQVPGDYDGDGKTDIAVWRPSDGNWYIRNSSSDTQSVISYGILGDTPVPGDYDGDGKTDVAVWRNGYWFVKNSAAGTQSVVPYGTAGDTPVPGDYDGDGKTDMAVWRPSNGTWYILNSGTGTQNTPAYGITGDIPVPGDYDGDGKTDMAVWRSSDFNWYILNSATGTQTVVNYGTTGDVPVPGDYNNIGKTEIAVWRPAQGNWYIMDSTAKTQRVVNWGTSTDNPVKSNQPVQ